MALFPIYGRFAGDFLAHLVAVDTGDTMDQVAEKVAVHSVDRRIARPSSAGGYDVLLDGEVVAPATTLGELGIVPLAWVDVRFRA